MSPNPHIQLTRAERFLRRLFVGRRGADQVASERRELCPAEIIASPPAIYLDGELDRILALQPDTNLAFEMDRLNGGSRRHSATTAYRLDRATLAGGAIYRGAMKHNLIDGRPPAETFAAPERISTATMTTTWCSSMYFGHWLADEMTAALAAQRLAPAVCLRRTYSAHQEQYAAVFDLSPRPISCARFEQLWVLDDVGQNRFKRERYETLRRRLAPLAGSPPHGVWIWRGRTGAPRMATNEDQAADSLARRGFLILEPHDQTVEQVARASLGARIVAGVEGSHLYHGLYTIAEGGAFLAVQPPKRFNNVIKDYTDCMAMRYATVVGNVEGDEYSIDLDRMNRTIDLVEAAI